MSLQHLNSHKTVATEVAGKRFLISVLPNRMQSQMVSAGKPLQASLNIKNLKRNYILFFILNIVVKAYLALERIQPFVNLSFMKMFLGVLFKSLQTPRSKFHQL